jgi:hypothetical protein
MSFVWMVGMPVSNLTLLFRHRCSRLFPFLQDQRLRAGTRLRPNRDVQRDGYLLATTEGLRYIAKK